MQMTSSTPARAAHLPALQEPHAREEVGRQLQGLLVELLDLAALGKHLHWNVVGPHFRPLHLQLDESVDAWRELADAVAERAAMLGVAPDGQSATVAAASPLRGVERGPLEDHVVVRELTDRLADVAERARERIDPIGELDAASQDVVIEAVRALEEQLWMLRIQAPATHEH
jgi:starvation-inducible DNA-binding protein